MYEEWLNTEHTDTEWRQIAKPIEELLKCKLIGYDPNFLFRMKDGSQANVPFSIVMGLCNIFSFTWTDNTEKITRQYGKRK